MKAFNTIGGMISILICKYCGEEIKKPRHWKQKYHLEPRNGQTESCSELANLEKGCKRTRKYRKKHGRINETIIGSRNANLGKTALTNFDAEFDKVHREKMRLCGS